MVFYGLSLNTGILYGDYYINFLLVTLVEFPGNVVPLPMIERLGRIKSHFIYMGVGGLACLSTILTVNYVGEGNYHVSKLNAIIHYLLRTSEYLLSLGDENHCKFFSPRCFTYCNKRNPIDRKTLRSRMRKGPPVKFLWNI